MPGPLAESDQPDNSGGCMIALYPPAKVAKALTLHDGLPVEEIHLTIAYAGNAADVDPVALRSVARQLAARSPVGATISGNARFTGGETDVFVALADSAAIEELRRDTVDRLSASGISIPRDHGHTPHLTRKYVGPDDPDPAGRLAAFPVTFTAVSVVHGKTRTDYPFDDQFPGQAREAYAAGWALSGGPMTESVKVGCDAAVAHALEYRHDPAILEVTLDLGKLQGTWAEVYRRREELAGKHVKAITAAWRKLVKRLDVRDLITAYRRELVMFESDGPSQKQKDAAKGALLLWLRQILTDPGYQDLVSAITAAMAEAIAEGRTAMLAVAADQAAARGFDWDRAYRAMLAAVTDAQTQGAASAVTQQIMNAVAADAARLLAKLDAEGQSDSEIAKALEDEIQAEDGAAVLAADTAASGYYGDGGFALAAAEGIELDWLTAGDGRVCPLCQDNEDNGPYDPSAFPDFPGHPRCRCTPAPAVPLRFSAFSDFLVR